MHTKHAIVVCFLNLHFYAFLSTNFVGRNCNITFDLMLINPMIKTTALLYVS